MTSPARRARELERCGAVVTRRACRLRWRPDREQILAAHVDVTRGAREWFAVQAACVFRVHELPAHRPLRRHAIRDATIREAELVTARAVRERWRGAARIRVTALAGACGVATRRAQLHVGCGQRVAA